MQQIVLLHSPPCEDSSLCLHAWWGAITAACTRGYLSMLQWLLDHPLGQELRENMKPHQKYSYLVGLAGQHDQVEIMQYLSEQAAVDEVNGNGVIQTYARNLMIAIRDDHYNAVKWMVETLPFPERGQPGDMAIDITTRCRRFEILKLFPEMGSSGVIDLTQNEENRSDQVAAWWSRSRNVMDFAAGSGRVDMFKWLLSTHPKKVTKDAMDRAACCGHLEMVRWLHDNRSEGCTEKAMDDAASRGHFDVVKWLHINRSEGCTKAAMDGAAANGHLEIVKWRHVNRSEGCTNKAMDGAARAGNLKVLKWLSAIRSEGCSPLATQNAVKCDRVAVLDWMHQHFPDYAPSVIDVSMNRENMFEVLLFLHVHLPHLTTPEFTATARQYNISRSINAWLADNYASS